MTLSRESFEYLRAALRLRSGYVLEDDKLYFVETRLLPVARANGCATVEELIKQLRGRANERITTDVVEAMTINETFFFRDHHPFDTLTRVVVPELVRARAASRELNVWCAASSSGQEPYSVALLIRHYFPALAGWAIRLVASDLSAAMLDRARAGWYSDLEVSRGLPAEFKAAYFDRHAGGWQLRDDVRRMVEFRPINLLAAWPVLPAMDVVLLRNVLIYFDAETKVQVLERVRRVLRPDGYLVLGGAESTHNLAAGFTPVTFDKVSFFRPS